MVMDNVYQNSYFLSKDWGLSLATNTTFPPQSYRPILFVLEEMSDKHPNVSHHSWSLGYSFEEKRCSTEKAPTVPQMLSLEINVLLWCGAHMLYVKFISLLNSEKTHIQGSRFNKTINLATFSKKWNWLFVVRWVSEKYDDSWYGCV